MHRLRKLNHLTRESLSPLLSSRWRLRNHSLHILVRASRRSEVLLRGTTPQRVGRILRMAATAITPKVAGDGLGRRDEPRHSTLRFDCTNH
jgi:hypothetical protein